MGKSKKPSRDKRLRKESAADVSQQAPRVLTPNPPRRNVALLVLSTALLFGFLCYLAAIAWTASQ